MSISSQKILLYDRGDHSFLAERFAQDAGEVWIYTPILGRQPKSRDDQIGAGLDGVEKIDDFEKYRDKADLIVFPGEFEGETCNRLRKEGYRVFGSGLSADLEINRTLFLETLKKVGLPVIKTYRAEGIDEAIEYLKDKEDKWIKTSYTRGDFDTIHFQNMKTFMPWFDLMRNKLGTRGSETIELLIQDSFPALVESGSDRYCIDGKMSPKGTIGFEDKDKSYIYRVVPEIPKVLDDIDQKMSPEFKRLGYRGAYSTEVRINEKGAVRFTDLTARFGSPPTESLCENYTTFTQDVFDVADGKIPKMEEQGEYGAMIVLVSSWNEDHEICVDFPDEIKSNVKLRHSYKHNDNYYCVPNESAGYFGAVVTQGVTLKEAIEKANEIAEQVICLDLEYTPIDLEKCEKLISKGEQYGIII
jgi:hypothetical protein